MQLVYCLLLITASLSLGRGLSSSPDHYFDPPGWEERMRAIPYHQQVCRDGGNFETGILVHPLLSGNDVVRNHIFVSRPFGNYSYVSQLVSGMANNGVDNSAAFAFFHADGDLDTSFHTDGIHTPNLTASDDIIHSLASIFNTSAVFAGRANGPNNVGWLVGRIRETGSLDTAFFTTGYRTSSFLDNDEIFRAVYATTDNNRILYAAGYAWFYGYNYVVAAFNSNGTLDTSFFNKGYHLTEASAHDSGALAIGLVTTRPTLAGPIHNGTDWDFGLVRYMSEGRIDTVFHTDGVDTITVLTGDDRNYALYVDTVGSKVLTAGYAFNTANNDFAIVRVNITGVLDTSFHTDGKYTHDISGLDDVIFAITPDLPTNKIYAAGSTDTAGNLNVAVARYLSDGRLDTAFGTDGIGVYDVRGGNDIGTSISISVLGGKFHVASRSVNGANQDFAVLRIHTDGSLAFSGEVSRSFGTNGGYVKDLGGADVIYEAQFEPGTSNDIYSFGKSGNNAAVAVFAQHTGIGTSFDTDGFRTYDLGGTEVFYSGFNDSTSFFTQLAVGEKDGDFLIARITTGGVLGTGFSTDGWATVDFSGSDTAYGVNRITPNFYFFGKDGGANTQMAIAKYLNGNIDTSFHTDGKAVYNPTGNSAVIKYGQSTNYFGQDTTDLIAIAVRTDGILNTSFHTDGISVVDFGGTETLEGVYVQTTTTKIYMVGGNGSDWIATRLIAGVGGGMLDTTFDTDGKATYDFGGTEIATGVQVFESNKKTIVTGDNGTDLIVARLQTDGTLDTSFTTDGYAILDVAGVDTSQSLVLDRYGDICIFGAANNNNDFEVVCVDP